MNQTQLLTHFESETEDIMDQEQFHREALKGLMMLCETPLNPDAKEWEPKRQPRTFHHLRGKMMKRLKRCEYFRSKKLLCDVDTDIISVLVVSDEVVSTYSNSGVSSPKC